MRKVDGKFILVDITELGSWLNSSSFSRGIKILQVHHTFQPDYSVFRRVRDHFALLRDMERSHVFERGFSEVAQNLTTFPDGLVAVADQSIAFLRESKAQISTESVLKIWEALTLTRTL